MWHFWGFSCTWSSNIDLNRPLDGVSQLWHQSFLTGSAAIWKQACNSSASESPPWTWLAYIFSFPLSLPRALFSFLLFFPPVSWSPPHQAKDPAFSHRTRSLKAEPLFPASGKLGREGGVGLSSWLPALARCRCEKKQGRQMWWWQGNCEAKEANSARKLWIYTHFSKQSRLHEFRTDSRLFIWLQFVVVFSFKNRICRT